MGAESYPTQRPNGHLLYAKDVAAPRSRPCDSAPILGLREFCGVHELDNEEPTPRARMTCYTYPC